MPSFPPIPLRLVSDRLVLAPQQPSDAPRLATLLSLRGRGAVTTEQAAERVAAMQRTVAELGIGARVMRRHGDDQPLGCCALIIGRGTVAEPELAHELLPSAQGHGCATEASRALLDAAFATGRPVVRATIRPWNHESLRVVRRLGLRSVCGTSVCWVPRRRVPRPRPRR